MDWEEEFKKMREFARQLFDRWNGADKKRMKAEAYAHDLGAELEHLRAENEAMKKLLDGIPR